jgi:tetratricopeptide (TPR) repeat protein
MMTLQDEGILMLVRKHLNDAEGYLNSGAYDSARTSVESAIAAARNQDHTPSLAAAYYGMASVIWNSGGASEDAHRYASLAAQHTKANTTTDLLVRTLIARLKVARGNYDAAQVILDDLLNFYEREERDAGRADVYRSLGDMYLEQGKYDLSREKYFSALELYRKLEDPLNHAGLLVSLGGLMYQMQDQVEAVRYWQEARTLAEDNGYRHIVQAVNRAMDLLKS